MKDYHIIKRMSILIVLILISRFAGRVEAGSSALAPNELGSIPVLEYHNFGEEGRWTRSPENFRKDLDTLYRENYRPVNLNDFIKNEIKIPEGTTPVIFTFDDASSSQFRYIIQGKKITIDPSCAVGVMADFYRKHPDFPLKGTFYILPQAFGQPEYVKEKLKFLISQGFEIGNHTYHHNRLDKLTREEVAKELALAVQFIQGYLPNYRVKSLALPYGVSSKDKEWMKKGSYKGVSYSNDACLLVGAGPAYPPTHVKFDPCRLPRIQALTWKGPDDNAGKFGSEYWLTYFRQHPAERYVSDGDSKIITFPGAKSGLLRKAAIGSRPIKTY